MKGQGGEEEKQKNRVPDYPSIDSLPKCLQYPGFLENKVRQDRNNLTHPLMAFQALWQETGLEVEQLGLKPLLLFGMFLYT